MIIEEKKCVRCKKTKPVFEFYPGRLQKDGLSGYCKACNKARCHEYYQQNKKKMIIRSEEWRKNNLEKFRKYQREYAKKLKK